MAAAITATILARSASRPPFSYQVYIHHSSRAFINMFIRVGVPRPTPDKERSGGSLLRQFDVEGWSEVARV